MVLVRRLLLLLLMLLFSSVAWADHYKIGILAFQPQEQAMLRWQPLATYLQQQAPEHTFEVCPLNYGALDQAIKERKIDFLLTNPGHYVRLLHFNLVNRALVTQVNRIAGEEVAVFGGVIFTLAERTDLSNLQSLAGKSVASVAQGSLGGFQMQAFELYEAGISVDQLKMVWTEMPHDRVVEKVLQREADAGFVRTGVLERLISKGIVDARQIKIINRQNLTGFPLHVSTHLYPEWPFTALPHLRENVIRGVTGALLILPHDGPVVQQMRLHGFNVAADYEPVRDILRDLRLPPYTEIPGYYWSYLWEDYRWYIVIGVVVVLVILLLVVRLRLANRGLQESETRYRTLVQNIPGATYRCNNDRDWSMSFISSEIESITGYPAADFLNNSVRSYASIIHPDDRDMVELHVAEGIEKRKPFNMGYRILHHSGEVRWVYEKGQAIFNDLGEVKWLNGTILDHTREKELEGELIEARKMASLGTLVGGIAHEFNNTLAGMTGQIYLAKKEVQVPAVARRLETIQEHVFKVAEMIKQLLAFAHKDLVQMRYISFSECLREALKLNSVVTPPRAIIRQQISRDELIVSGDQGQLQQVVINLIRNACDAVESVDGGEITITLDRFVPDEAFLISHAGSKAASFAHLMVSDNGVGIAEEHLEEIFDPFFTTKEVGKGAGLGLSMVYGAMKGHKGIIEIDSKVGVGTHVDLYIPLHQEPLSAEAEQEQSAGVEQGRGETILLVDDNETFLETNRDIFLSMNYQVLTADNGLRACELFREHQQEIDLVITDLVMPLMGGVEAAEVFRSIQPDVKIIFATGYDRNESQLQSEKMRSETIIFKPFEIEKISALIHEKLR